MLKPTFSIVIPVYNAQNTISRSIESVLLQEMLDFELILVNDGSSDNSLQICKKYAKDNQKIRVIDKKMVGCLLPEMKESITRTESMLFFWIVTIQFLLNY